MDRLAHTKYTIKDLGKLETSKNLKQLRKPLKGTHFSGRKSPSVTKQIRDNTPGIKEEGKK